MLKLSFFYLSTIKYFFYYNNLDKLFFNFKSIKSNEKDNIIILVVEIICIIFSTFATLIYDEIIVIKKWGLDKDVATEIVKRAELEINAIGLLSSDNDDEEEESEGKNNNSLASSVYI